jgi:hypothetical protein
MIRIVVDDEQAKAIAKGAETVEISDRQGKVLGYLTHGFSDEDIALANRLRNSNQPRYTTQEVLSRLAAAEQR